MRSFAVRGVFAFIARHTGKTCAACLCDCLCGSLCVDFWRVLFYPIENTPERITPNLPDKLSVEQNKERRRQCCAEILRPLWPRMRAAGVDLERIGKEKSTRAEKIPPGACYIVVFRHFDGSGILRHCYQLFPLVAQLPVITKNFQLRFQLILSVRVSGKCSKTFCAKLKTIFKYTAANPNTNPPKFKSLGSQFPSHSRTTSVRLIYYTTNATQMSTNPWRTPMLRPTKT